MTEQQIDVKRELERRASGFANGDLKVGEKVRIVLFFKNLQGDAREAALTEVKARAPILVPTIEKFFPAN